MADPPGDDSEAKVDAFLRGALSPDEVTAFEAELERRPALQRALGEAAARAASTATFPSELSQASRQTIPSPPRAPRPQPTPLRTLSRPAPHPSLEVGLPIGAGGMATVFHATQVALGRPVAVKTALGPPNTSTSARLLAEARLIGRLEHPNIVPVHDIVHGADGVPQIVLKRLDGHPWSALFHNAALTAELHDVKDLLGWNVQVLCTVCQAVAFAHSRGVLHRDIKPDNVMIGAYGEVTLVDWGIASVVGAGDAAAGDAVAGTLAYMAPEQVAGDSSALGPWTDTYLLAATLFHVVTGRPPHVGRSYDDRREERFDDPPHPPLPPSVPAELAEILSRALCRDAAHRTVGPDELRRELQTFLSHRFVAGLVARAHDDAAAGAAAQAHGDDDSAERAFVRADFGYRAALDGWSDCAEAHDGLRALLRTRVEAAMARGALNHAAQLLRSVDDPPADLSARLAQAEQQAAEVEATLRRAARDVDRLEGLGLRRVLVTVFGVLWVCGWSAVALWPPPTLDVVILGVAGYLALGAVVPLARHATLLRHRQNRTRFLIPMFSLVATLSWLTVAPALGLSTTMTLTVLLLQWAVAAAAGALAIDARALPMAALYLAGFWVTAYVPALLAPAMIAGNVGLVVNMLLINWALTRQARGAAPAADRALAPPPPKTSRG